MCAVRSSDRLRQKDATVFWRVPPLRPSPVLFLSAFCWCSFAGTLPPVGFPTRPRSGFRVGESCRHVSGEGVEDHRVVGTDRGVDSEMVELFRELVGWWSWFQAVTHERWMRPLVRITPPSCAEPMCEAGSAHHPTLGLEGSVRSVDLRSVLFIYKYSVLGIRSEQVDGDNLQSPRAIFFHRLDRLSSLNRPNRCRPGTEEHVHSGRTRTTAVQACSGRLEGATEL